MTTKPEIRESRSLYGQFCPIAKACEVFTERWTPLIVREMICGSRRFSDIHRGVPLMSRSLLSKRLQEMERGGLVIKSNGTYQLTPAGEALAPIVLQLGHWGKLWMRDSLVPGDLDAGLLMWDMRRRIDAHVLGEGRTVVHFLYPDAPVGRQNWWLVVGEETDLCLEDPGLSPDLRVECALQTMTDIWMGDLSFDAALQSGALKVSGPSKLRMRLPACMRLSVFAHPAS